MDVTLRSSSALIALAGAALFVSPALRAQAEKADQPVKVRSADLKQVPKPFGPVPGKGAPKAGKFQDKGPFGPEPNAWFKATKIDLGTYLEGETASGKFEFTNPTEETVRLSNLSPNCQCAKAKLYVGEREYWIENQPAPQTIVRIEGEGKELKKTQVKHVAVAPGESGYVQIDMSLKGIKGRKEAYVSMRTTDPNMLVGTVTARATGLEYFRTTPRDINLNKMAWSETREWSFELASDVEADFEVTKVSTSADALKVTEQKKLERGGRAVWRISGTYGPDIDPRAGGGNVKVFTNLKDKRGAMMAKDMRIIAVITGPLTVRPGTFLPFGRIKRKEGASRVVEFEANDKFDLAVESVELANLSVDEKFVSVETTKEEGILKVEIKVHPDAPRGLARGDVTVKLNHPAIPEKALQFNGFVR